MAPLPTVYIALIGLPKDTRQLELVRFSSISLLILRRTLWDSSYVCHQPDAHVSAALRVDAYLE